MQPDRTALLIRCTKDEADAIRLGAAREYRTIGGYLMRILHRSLWIEEKFRPGVTDAFLKSRATRFRDEFALGTARTATLLRCSIADADRIRKAASRRDMSISDFVRLSLRRHWEAATRVQQRTATHGET
jgi:uncharacterized protein (DUF1778 family)